MQPIHEYNFTEGELLLIDKPAGWTSFDVVNKVRYLTHAKKVGHAGTLDPMATGLLILCTGKLTKTLTEFQNGEKEYTGIITVGANTSSYDRETPVTETFPTEHITHEMILEAAKKLTGSILQVPPAYSAKKVDGVRAYKKARRGEEITMVAAPVTISNFDILSINLPEIHFRVVCSKGTYIRSLAYDLGKELGSGAYLSSLCRTRIGAHLLENAWNLRDLTEKIKNHLSEKKFNTVC